MIKTHENGDTKSILVLLPATYAFPWHYILFTNNNLPGYKPFLDIYRNSVLATRDHTIEKYTVHIYVYIANITCRGLEYFPRNIMQVHTKQHLSNKVRYRNHCINPTKNVCV